MGFVFNPSSMARLFFAALMTFALLAPALGQPVAPTEPLVRFDDYRFRNTIPYQQWFTIRGKRTLFKAKADEVILTIRQDTATVYTGFWWKNTDTDVDFELFVDTKLRFNVEYTFDFEFFVDANTVDVPAELKKDLLKRLTELFTSASLITSNDVTVKMDEVITAFKAQYSPGSITFTGEGIRFVEDPRFVTDVKAYEADVRTIVATKVAIKNHDADSAQSRAALDRNLAALPSLTPMLTAMGLTQVQVDRISNIPTTGSAVDAALLSSRLAGVQSAIDVLVSAVRFDDELPAGQPGIVAQIQAARNQPVINSTNPKLGLSVAQVAALTFSQMELQWLRPIKPSSMLRSPRFPILMPSSSSMRS
jgi:hypothetical protein